jgi:hypothetical protein
MSSADRDRRRRGGPGRRQGWNGPGRSGPGWSGPGWYDESAGDWRGRTWNQTAWEPQEASQVDVPRKRVRIGDAERDQAVSLLSDHFVAGRLTQAEFEERSEVVTRARYSDDLEPLFDDLPSSTELQVVPGRANLRRRPGPPPPFLMLAPFLMIGLVITSVALTAPWLLWGMFWIVMISGMSRRRWHHHN